MLNFSRSLARPAFGRVGLAACALTALIGLAGCGGSDTGLERIAFATQQPPIKAFQCFRSGLTLLSYFDDGAVEDATQMAEFSSSAPSVVRVTDGNTLTASGEVIPKATLIPVGEVGQRATITATLADARTTVEVVIKPSDLELTPPVPTIAEGTRVILRPTAILGEKGSREAVRARRLISISTSLPNGAQTGGPANLVKIDERGNTTYAIALNNDRPDGASTTVMVTASTVTLSAGQSSACPITDSVQLTVRNEKLQSLTINLPNKRVPENVSQGVSVIGNFSGDYTQNLTSAVELRTADKDVAQFGFHGPNVVTSIPGAAGRSTAIVASFSQGLNSGSPTVQAKERLSVTDEKLVSLAVTVLSKQLDPPVTTPVRVSALPGTGRRFIAIGRFQGGQQGERLLNLTQDVFWSLRDGDKKPDPDVVRISNADGSEGRVIALQENIDPVTVRAQRTQTPASDGPPDSGVMESTTLAFDAMLATLFIQGPDSAIGVGQRVQLLARAKFASGGSQILNGKVIWQSHKPDFAVVSNSPFTPGRLTGIAPGMADITAYYQGATALYSVTVKRNPQPEPQPNPPMCTIPNPLPILGDCLIP